MAGRDLKYQDFIAEIPEWEKKKSLGGQRRLGQTLDNDASLI